MITITDATMQNNAIYKSNKITATLSGLSTDEKPLGYANGSSFLEEEVDDNGESTGIWSIYIFDEENMKWNMMASWTV